MLRATLERLLLRLYDLVLGRRWILPAATGLAMAVAVGLLLQLRLDMSFRPLFAEQDEAASATAAFERRFGQPSGAHIGVVIERDDVLTPAFLVELAALADRIAAQKHIVEVQSLDRFLAPEPASAGRLERLRALPDSALRALPRHPGLRRLLLAEDGRKTLLLARLDLPLQDLAGRGPVIRAFRAEVERALGDRSTLHFVGVSVVEDAYAEIVLQSLIRSFFLTTLALMAFLWLIYRRFAPVVIALTGVSLAAPISLALLVVLGYELTIINSLVPVVVLIIGVADAIHMLEDYYNRPDGLWNKASAVRAMYRQMWLPCLMTTLTTAAGFLSLRLAHIQAIRDFGLVVCLAVLVVFVLNLLLVPYLLDALPAERLRRPASKHAFQAERWVRHAAGLVRRRNGLVLSGAALFVLACVLSLPFVRVNQYFNREVAPDHPLRTAQQLLEAEFTGILGPEIGLRRTDGGALTEPADLARIRRFEQAVRTLPEVRHTESFLALLPPGLPEAEAGRYLRNDPPHGLRLGELLSPDHAHAALIVRTTDMGTERAVSFGEEVQRLAAAHLGAGYEADLVGQWWLAQRGMQNIMRDMIASFLTSCLLILPLLALLIRNLRLFLISLAPNLLPVLFALAFTVWIDVPVRIGTAMVLAIALGIAVDDTIHLLARLHEAERTHASPEAVVESALRHAGSGMVHTTLVLVMGFMSMLWNDLLALRDMGLIASATLAVALLADMYLTPALYLRAVRARRPAPAGPKGTR